MLSGDKLIKRLSNLNYEYIIFAKNQKTLFRNSIANKLNVSYYVSSTQYNSAIKEFVIQQSAVFLYSLF